MEKPHAIKTIGLGLSAAMLTATPLLTVSAGIATSLVATPAEANTLTNWQFNPNNYQLEFTVPRGTTPRYFLMAQPARIVVDLPNTDVGTVPEQQVYTGAVRQIRVAQFQPGLARIVVVLAPDAVLAPRQVELQQANGGGGGGGDRWTLRPLLMDTSNVATQPSSTAPASPQAVANPETPDVTASLPSPAAPNAAQAVPSAVDEPELSADTGTPPSAPAAEASPAVPSSTAPSLPPLEPGATQIQIQPPEPSEVAIAPSPVPALVPSPSAAPTVSPEPSAIPSPASSEALARPSITSPSVSRDAVALTIPSPEAPTSEAPTSEAPTIETAALPPAIASGSQTVTVNVPPLTAGEVAQPTLPQRSSPEPSSGQTNIVTVPAPPSLTFTAPDAAATTVTPGAIAAAPSQVNVLLPAGTVLSLRYPRTDTLSLPADKPWQEVLLLDQSVFDAAGNLIVPEGSQVLGRFETGRNGSRFIVQAIAIEGRNVLIKGESERLEGEREVPRSNLIRNSAIGAVGIGLIGILTGGIGLLGLAAGAAGGAAGTYLTAPQPAVIQPNQIVEVRLTEDIPRLF